MNISLKVFWNNEPLPLEGITKPSQVIVQVPFGALITDPAYKPVDNVVTSINGKTGVVLLQAKDITIESGVSVEEKLADTIDIETNRLNLLKKADLIDLETTQEKVELNRLALLSKADITALAMLAALVDTKADQQYVNEQIAAISDGDEAIIASIQEISNALAENDDLLEALEYTVANHVRFDVATQALTSLQKSNARTNIGAEELGVAAMLVAQVTVQSIGAATAAQGAKANTALQSADVAPVALSGLFSALLGQNKIFDVVHSAYIDGTNSVITATDTLGQMLGKLQAQIKNIPKTEWVRADKVGTIHANITPSVTVGANTIYLEFAKIDGLLWVRGGFTLKGAAMSAGSPNYITAGIVTFNNGYKMQAIDTGGAMTNISVQPNGYSSEGNVIRSLFWSDRVSTTKAQSLTAVQSFVVASNLLANTNIRLMPSCIGVLI